MSALLRIVLVVAVIAAGVTVYATAPELPTRVATHFGGSGRANGWMSHDGYLAFMLAMSTVFPLAIAVAIGLMPRTGRALLRKRGFETGRQDLDEPLRWVAGSAALVGVLLCAFMVGMHVLIIDANQRVPAHLDGPAFAAVLVAFLALLAICLGILAFRLRGLRG